MDKGVRHFVPSCASRGLRRWPQGLRDLLQRKELEAPAVGAPAHTDELARLEDEAFERAYLEALRSAHEEAIRELESCAAQDVDADRQAFAQRLLPMLRVHCRELDHLLGH